MITFEGLSEAHLAIGDAFFREDFLPMALTMLGFEGAYVLVDRERGASVSITLWASREALEASEGQARRFLAQWAAVSGREPRVEAFEVTNAHLQAGTAR
jgi:heme-degrading monooxygenase HmoA